jgi:flavorubredoxin
MWGSTERVARAITDGLTQGGADAKLMSLASSHNSDVIAEVLEAKAVFVGGPTLNNWLYPSVAGFLAYMRGLKPVNKFGAAFGSYGWAGGAKKATEAEMAAAGISVEDSGLDFQYRPGEDELQKARDFGRRMATRIAA